MKKRIIGMIFVFVIVIGFVAMLASCGKCSCDNCGKCNCDNCGKCNCDNDGEASLATTSEQVNFDEDVYFADADVKTGTGGTNTATPDTVSIGQTDPDSATFYVKSLGNVGESVTFWFTIKNDSTEFDAEISLDTGYPTTTNTEMFNISYSIVDDGTANEGPVIVKAGQSATVYVTVTLKVAPQQNQTAAFNVNLTATSVDIT